MSLPAAKDVLAAQKYLEWVRLRTQPCTQTPAEVHLLVYEQLVAELVAALRRQARLTEALRVSKQINWSIPQEHTLEEHYGAAMLAIAVAEGRS